MAIVGNVWTLIGTFQQQDPSSGDFIPTNPDAPVIVSITRPKLYPKEIVVPETYTFGVDSGVIHDSDGVFHFDQLCTIPGYWVGTMSAGPGKGEGADDTGSTWFVEPTPRTPH